MLLLLATLTGSQREDEVLGDSNGKNNKQTMKF